MNDSEGKVASFMQSNGGYITSDDCMKIGVHRNILFELAGSGLLKKAAAGIYCLPDTIQDELYILHLRYPSLVFSHETALYLLGYSDQIPFKYNVTVPVGFHSSSLSPYSVFQIKEELIDCGKTDCKTEYGNTIPVYSIERTLCDLLHNRKNFDSERFLPAFKKYALSSSRDNISLLKFAKLLHVEKKIRLYLETTI